MLIGLGKMIKKVAENVGPTLTLLASKILGFTSVTSVPVQKNSLIMYGGYTSALVSKREAPLLWEEKSKQLGIIKTNGTSYLCTSYSTGGKMFYSEDMDTFEEATFPILNPYTSQNDILGAYHYDENNQYNAYAGIPYGSGFYITGGLVNGTSQYFKSKNGISSLQPFNIPADASTLGDHGTIGDSSYFSFYIGQNQTDRKFYKTSKIELSGSNEVTYSEIDLTVNGAKYRPDGDVYHANGIYAVRGQLTSGSGNTYAIFTSSNGSTFTKFSDANNYLHLNLVNNTFVYGEIDNGASIIIFSATPDFETFDIVNLFKPEGTTSFSLNNAVVLNNKMYAPFYSTSFFAVSEDGVTWTTEDAGVNIQYDLLLLSGTTTVNVPIEGGSSYYTTMTESTVDSYVTIGQRHAYYSEDQGSTWVQGPFTIFNSDSAVYANGMWLTQGVTTENPGNYQGMMKSLDGKTWAPSSAGKSYKMLTEFNDGFVGVAYPNIIGYSPDGTNWVDFTADIYTITSLVEVGGKLYATGDTSVEGSSPNKLYSSLNGITWVSVDLPSYLSSPNGHLELTKYNDNIFVYLKYSQKAGYSSDGINWTEVSSEAINSSAYIYFINSRFFTVDARNGGSYQDYTSSDLVNWTPITGTYNTSNFPMDKIAYGNGIFFGSKSADNSGSNPSYTSTDGVSWTQVANSQGHILDSFVNGKFFLQLAGKIAYTEDATNFTFIQLGNFQDQKMFTKYGPIKTLVETQVSIGGQGDGSAEVLTPVDVFNPSTYAEVKNVTIKNLSQYPVSYDLGIVAWNSSDPMENMFNSRTIKTSDQIVQPGETISDPYMLNSNIAFFGSWRLVILPSSVDALEVKIYG